jgi:hypothetical protein
MRINAHRLCSDAMLLQLRYSGINIRYRKSQVT